jgi:hypothetical protein
MRKKRKTELSGGVLMWSITVEDNSVLRSSEQSDWEASHHITHLG